MNLRQRDQKRKRARQHIEIQKRRRRDALTQAEESARKSKKGKKGVIAAMKKFGYELDKKGNFKRLPKEETA